MATSLKKLLLSYVLGTSFAEALGMITPTKSKKKNLIKGDNSPGNPVNNDVSFNFIIFSQPNAYMYRKYLCIIYNICFCSATRKQQTHPVH